MDNSHTTWIQSGQMLFRIDSATGELLDCDTFDSAGSRVACWSGECLVMRGIVWTMWNLFSVAMWRSRDGVWLFGA